MEQQSPQRTPAGPYLVLSLAAAKLLLHLLTANRYGVFRDEMYGLACAQHLAWGYTSHPPGGIVIAWIARFLFGDSLFGLRFFPALAGAALVVLTGKMVREMGGRTFAQGLAALAVCVAPIYLIFDHWLMMNAFEPLIWLGCAYCVLRVITTGDGWYWLGFGALAGIGLETKYSILFLIVGILIGLALTPQRQRLSDWRLWAGLLIGGVIALPNFLWQLRHGFPFLEHLHQVAASQRDVIRTPMAFVIDQMVMMEPATALLWIGGTVWLLIGPQRDRFGVFGWTFLSVLGAFIVLKGKNYYVSPVYPIVFAAGAIAAEQITEQRRRRWMRTAYVGLVAVSGIVLAPLTVPILSPTTLVRYEQRLGLGSPVVFEHQENGPLPQYFADEFGWENMVRETARVYHTLSPEEQKRTAIFANDWGDAAAIDFFGPKYGLPRAISNRDSYWDWGPRGYDGSIVIILKSDGTGDRQHFASVETVGHVEDPYSRRDEWFEINVCRGLQFNLQEAWPKMREFE
jgi:hypothetical protein